MRKISKGLLFSVSIFLFCAAASAQNTVTVPEEIVAYPDMIIHNAKVITMDDTSFGLNTSRGTTAEAIAIRGDKIQAIGNNARILSLAGPGTDRIDAKGRMVMPGIVDAHTHIHNNELNYWVSQNPEILESLAASFSVSGLTDEELEQGIRLGVQQHVGSTAPGRWAFINVGSRGDGAMSPGVPYLGNAKFTMAMLDQLAPNHPIMLFSHPSYVMNTAATLAMEDLYGSKFDPRAAGLDEDGRVRSTAAQYRRALIIDMYFHTRVPQLADLVEQGLAKNAAVGITTYSSHIMGLRFLDAFNILVRQNRMPIRFAYTHWFGFQAGYGDAANFYRRMGDMAGMGSDYMWQSAVGLSSIDSGPPRMCSTMEASQAVKALEWCDNAEGSVYYEATRIAIANYQRVAVGHAYADKGVDYFMNAVEDAMRDNPAITLDYIRSRRLTSDHCGFYPRKAQIPRLAKLGMIISCGGNVLTRSYPHLLRYSLQYADRIAPARSAIEGGVMVVVENEAGVRGNTSSTYFGDAVPFLTRKNSRGDDVAPEEAVNRITLMKMMTSWPARFVLKEDVLGTLEPGKFADILVLNGDYFTVPVEELKDIIPFMTIVGGKIRVLRSEFAQELGRSSIGPQLEFQY
ncbi:MAG: amidohydrolase family protein [Acidobacteria bacterium]|nr:amidohydrolase family protein [Acidobacteriota bacterium]